MVNLKKRIEALAELYESERFYINDLIIWEELLRSSFISATTFENSKYSIIESMLKDSDLIKNEHLNLFSDLRNKNLEILKRNNIKIDDTENELIPFPRELIPAENLDLEYYSVFEKLVKNYQCYIKVTENLPRAEFEFERLMSTDEKFNKRVTDFMVKNNLIELGTKNFFYRPSVKISRYPILFKAIAKHEPNEARKKKYYDLIKDMDNIAKVIDHIYKVRAEFFETFVLSYRLVYGENVKEKFSLCLFYRRTKLIKEGKLIVKKNKLDPASYKQVYVFNRMILICLTISGPYQNIIIDDDPIFLCRAYVLKHLEGFSRGENLGELFPIFIVQKRNKSIKAIYFEDKSTRDVYFYKINSAIQKIRKKLSKEISIKKVESIENRLHCYCKAEISMGNFIGLNRSEVFDADTCSIDFSNMESMHTTEEVSEELEEAESDSSNDSVTLMSDSTFIEDESADCNERENLRSESINSVDEASNNEDSSKDRSNSESNSDSEINSEKNNITETYSEEDNITGIDSKDNSYESNSEADSKDNSYDNSNINSDDTDIFSNEIKQIKFNFSNFGKEDKNYSRAEYINNDLTYSDIFSSDEEIIIEDSEEEKTEEHKKEKSGGFWNKLCGPSVLPLNNISIPNQFNTERTRKNREMTFYSTDDGIFRCLEDEVIQIYHKSSNKIYYDCEYELLIFIADNRLHLCEFNSEKKEIEPTIFNTDIRSFFYGKLRDTAYIALVSIEEFTFSIIHLLSVVFNRESPVLDINVVRKLYVGFTVFNIFFLKGRIIISCKDFEIIEIDTLRTQELLEVYDTTLSLLLESKEHFNAKSIFKLDSDFFLLCFDGGGYLIDRTGRYREENVSYDWEMMGEDFMVYEKWIIVIGKGYISIFEINTGKMVFIEYMPSIKFVIGSNQPLIYDEDNLYRIDFGGLDLIRDENSGYKSSSTRSDGLYSFDSGSYSRSLSNLWDSNPIDYYKSSELLSSSKDSWCSIPITFRKGSTDSFNDSCNGSWRSTSVIFKDQAIDMIKVLDKIRILKIKKMKKIAKKMRKEWKEKRNCRIRSLEELDIIKIYE